MKQFLPATCLRAFGSGAGLLLLLLPLEGFSQSTGRLSLSDAITAALKTNPEVLSAQKAVDAAEGRILQAGRIPNPEFAITWNATPSNLNLSNADERDISFSQQFEFPSKRSNRIDIALHDKQIAELNFDRAKSIVTSKTKKVYYAVLLASSVADGLQEQQKLLKELQQLLTSKFQAGQANYLEVVRAKVEAARTNNDLIEAQREYQFRTTQLNLVIGREPNSPFETIDSLNQVRLIQKQDSLFSYLIQQSSTLKIAGLSLSRQQSALSFAQSSYLPDFGLGLSSQRRREGNGFNNNLWGLEFRVSVPLWFWQEPKGEVQEARSFLDIAALNQQAAERRVRASLLNALDFVRVVQSQVATFDSSLLADAKDILTTALAQYENNQIDVLNLFDVYRTYRATKIEYARALYNYAVAIADLEVAAELPTQE